MPTPTEVANAVRQAPDWNERVALIRRIPEQFGTADQSLVYAEVARSVYAPNVEAGFAYVHWREDYELHVLEPVYERARAETNGFSRVSREDLADVMRQYPRTLRVFRLIVGFTQAEFAESCALAAQRLGLVPVSRSAVASLEQGRTPTEPIAATCAATIDLLMSSQLFPLRGRGGSLRPKIDKPDTSRGWASIQHYAERGVPLVVLLHQRAYGGAFRQLLDATSSARGNVLEDAVQDVFRSASIPFLRTGPHNQEEVGTRFGLTVRPTPDFVAFDSTTEALRALLECKIANDGGTARDKASRFRSLRAEANRLGGVPLFAVLDGLGWRRTSDALGPVIRDTDGRTFFLSTLPDMLSAEPFPGLRGLS